MRLFIFILSLLCVVQIDNCYGIYSLPIYKEASNICSKRVYSVIDDGSNAICKKYKICKLFFCVGDMVFGWFIHGGKKIFDCLIEDEVVKIIQANELILHKELKLDSESDQPQQSPDDFLDNQKKSIFKKRRPLTNNRKTKTRSKNESTEKSFLEKDYNSLNQESSTSKANSSLHNVNISVQKPQKISFRNFGLKKCYNLFLGAHLITIIIATYKFLRSFYRWAPLNFQEIILRIMTSKIENRTIDIGVEAHGVDTDSEGSDT